MNRLLLSIALGVFTVLGCAAPVPQNPAAAEPISVRDVIRLARAGISDEIILDQIHRKGAPAQLTTDEILELKKAGVSDRVVSALVGSPDAAAVPAARRAPSSAGAPAAAAGPGRTTASGSAARSAPSPASPPAAAAGPVSPPATASWASHTDPMGFSINHPADWKVVPDHQLGRVTVQGSHGERVVVWPMFIETRRLDEHAAGVLLRQMAAQVENATPWTAPQSSGRYVLVSTRSPQRKAAAAIAWANSPSGASILLYLVSAPASAYEASVPVLAGILQSFRVANAPAGSGGGSAGKALGTVQYVRWSDPMENAFTASVPQGWKVLGGMYRFGATDIRPMVTLVCPCGGILIRIGQKDFGAFAEPIYSAMGSIRGGSLPFSDGSSLQIHPYLTGQQFARYYVEHVLRDCAGVRVTAGRERPDLAGTFNQEAQQFGVPAGQMSAGDIDFTCSSQGAQLTGFYLAATMRVPTDVSRRGAGGALWYIYKVGGYIAIPEWRQDAEAIARQVVGSMQVNPEWRARPCPNHFGGGER